MSKNKFTRKHHLTGIKEWLALTETPLRKAQDATGEALKEHYTNHDTTAMFNMSDIAQGINRALVWVMHSQDLIGQLLKPDDESPEPEMPYRSPTSFRYYCNDCENYFGDDDGVSPGENCPDCGNGTINVAIPF